MSFVHGNSGVSFTGRLIRDPERKTGNSGRSYVSLNVSVTTGAKQDGQQYAPSIVVGTTVLGAAADACMRLEKGDMVTVTALAIESREGQDGKKWYNALADSVLFDAGVIERLCLRTVTAAVDAMMPGAEPDLLMDDDAKLPF